MIIEDCMVAFCFRHTKADRAREPGPKSSVYVGSRTKVWLIYSWWLSVSKAPNVLLKQLKLRFLTAKRSILSLLRERELANNRCGVFEFLCGILWDSVLQNAEPSHGNKASATLRHLAVAVKSWNYMTRSEPLRRLLYAVWAFVRWVNLLRTHVQLRVRICEFLLKHKLWWWQENSSELTTLGMSKLMS